MEYIKLSNGFSLPVIGYGTFPQNDTLIQNVSAAYDAGYRMIDTSDNYHNEEFVGEGLVANNISDCTIVTKYSRSKNEQNFFALFGEQKKKLGGKVDVYLLHWPYPFLWKYQWRLIEELYLKGYVKAIGVCNFEVDKLQKLLKICRVAPMINQIERHPLFQQNDILHFCQEHNIKVMSYSPLARYDDELFNSAVLNQLAEKYHKSVNQIILRWDIDTGTIPIPASSSSKHIEENIGVFDFNLTQSDIQAINSLESGKRIRFDPKKRFGTVKKVKFLLRRITLIFYKWKI